MGIVTKRDIRDNVEEGTRTASRRLTNIRPHEVSLVDEPANGKPFLIVKRKGEIAMGKKNDEKILKSEGEAEEKKEELQEEAKPEAEGEEKKEEGEASEEDKGADEAESSEESSEDVAKSFKNKVTMIEKSVGKMEQIKKAVAPEQFEMFNAMADALDFVNGTLDLVKGDIETFIESGGTTGFMGKKVVTADEVAKALTEKVQEAFGKVEDVLVEKRGKRMKGSRLKKLKEAVGVLDTLVKELEGVEGEVKKSNSESTETSSRESEDSSENNSSVEAIIEKAFATFGKRVEEKFELVSKRLDAVESKPAIPASEDGDDTEEVTKSAESKKSLWSGII